MISNTDVGNQISDLMLDLFLPVDKSLAMVKETYSAEEAAAYQKATGGIAGAIVMAVWDRLYEGHPAIKPPNWDD